MAVRKVPKPHGRSAPDPEALCRALHDRFGVPVEACQRKVGDRWYAAWADAIRRLSHEV